MLCIVYMWHQLSAMSMNDAYDTHDVVFVAAERQ